MGINLGKGGTSPPPPLLYLQTDLSSKVIIPPVPHSETNGHRLAKR